MLTQMAPTVDGIAPDHVARYRYAVEMIESIGIMGRCLDVGCGCGYGTKILADSDISNNVVGIDVDEEALKVAGKHYKSANNHFLLANLKSFELSIEMRFELITMFEVLEHTPAALAFLAKAHDARIPYLVASVPNEEVVPFDRPTTHPDHYRHFTPSEFESELESVGYRALFRGGQIGKKEPNCKVTSGFSGKRTLVVVARRVP